MVSARNSPVLIAALAGLLAGFAAGRLAGSPRATEGGPRRSGGPEDAAALARLESIERKLDEIAGAVERLAVVAPQVEGGPVAVPVEAPSRMPVAGEERWDEIQAAIGRLEGRIADREELLTMIQDELSGRSTIARLREEGVPVDWSAWSPVLDAWRADQDSAKQMVKLLTAREMLDRFGPPTDVWVVPQGITWQYARDRDLVTDEWGTEIIVRIPDGYVTQIAVRGHDWEDG